MFIECRQLFISFSSLMKNLIINWWNIKNLLLFHSWMQSNSHGSQIFNCQCWTTIYHWQCNSHSHTLLRHRQSKKYNKYFMNVDNLFITAELTIPLKVSVYGSFHVKWSKQHWKKSVFQVLLKTKVANCYRIWITI